MRILTLHENKNVQGTVTTLLDRCFCNFSVQECMDIDSAVKHLDSEAFDLVLTDDGITGIDGTQLVDTVAQHTQASIGLVLFKKNDTQEIINHNRVSFVIDYPIHIDELRTKIIRVYEGKSFLSNWSSAASIALENTIQHMMPKVPFTFLTLIELGCPPIFGDDYIKYFVEVQDDVEIYKIALITSQQGCRYLAENILEDDMHSSEVSGEDMHDSLKELINIIAGAMQNELSYGGEMVKLSTPFTLEHDLIVDTKVITKYAKLYGFDLLLLVIEQSKS